MALKGRKVMEEILDEMEEEHDDAFARITLLETQEEECGGGGVAAEVTTEEEESVQMRRGKAVARRRSLISLGMSAAVGAVVWAADAPCLPLLAGLFATVGVSMCSVARFFFLRESAALRGGRPASSDAVALLSLNWFLLGVLTSPMLPAPPTPSSRAPPASSAQPSPGSLPLRHSQASYSPCISTRLLFPYATGT
uniref:Uncharacterized protein n=1 Tax=Oryza punctata TaxID=4537 RepID=A0A0E0JSY5_ORYPU